MIFKPDLAQKSVTGEKTMTRRLVKPGEWLALLEPTGRKAVITPKGVIKWVVGRTYAIQPGRTQKAIGRLKLLDIRKEGVVNISEDDARVEGVEPVHLPTGKALYKPAFASLWNEMHAPGAFGDNPEVWVLVFEAVKDEQNQTTP